MTIARGAEVSTALLERSEALPGAPHCGAAPRRRPCRPAELRAPSPGVALGAAPVASKRERSTSRRTRAVPTVLAPRGGIYVLRKPPMRV
jgi:hypothetical protein